MCRMSPYQKHIIGDKNTNYFCPVEKNIHKSSWFQNNFKFYQMIWNFFFFSLLKMCDITLLLPPLSHTNCPNFTNLPSVTSFVDGRIYNAPQTNMNIKPNYHIASFTGLCNPKLCLNYHVVQVCVTLNSDSIANRAKCMSYPRAYSGIRFKAFTEVIVGLMYMRALEKNWERKGFLDFTFTYLKIGWLRNKIRLFSISLLATPLV